MTTVRLDLLDILGKGYVIQHCVSFFRKKHENELFKNYVADALKFIVYNTGHHNDFVTINKSYQEIVNSMHQKNDDKEEKKEKTSDEVITNIRDKILRIT